ncbi:MAG: hypothetical protein IJZ85_12335 [Lachnospiraceae bacterium]|nr:hypothetical protein [Lachnospiraceae bacterium]
MLFFKKKKAKPEARPAEHRPVTRELKGTKALKTEADPKFAVICEITYMESDEVIV